MSQSPQPRYSALELRQATLAPAPSTARRCHVPPAGKWRVAMTNVSRRRCFLVLPGSFDSGLLFRLQRPVQCKTNTSRGPWRFGCCSCETHSAQPPDPQARGPLSLHVWHSLRLWTEVWPTQPAITQAVLLVLFNTTRTLSGPPSTGGAIAMDGGEVWVDTRKVEGLTLNERPVGLQRRTRNGLQSRAHHVHIPAPGPRARGRCPRAGRATMG